jgi:hypothetical protein
LTAYSSGGTSNESETPVILRLPTIFLDFDGVLHGESEVGSRPFNKLPLLEDALSKADSDFQIVISSSWRFHYTLDELKAHLGLLKKYVVGVTPEVTAGAEFRYREVMEIVEAYGLAHWIAIDDADYAFPIGLENLIRCAPRLGFTESEAKLVVRWLKRFGR